MKIRIVHSFCSFTFVYRTQIFYICYKETNCKSWNLCDNLCECDTQPLAGE